MIKPPYRHEQENDIVWYVDKILFANNAVQSIVNNQLVKQTGQSLPKYSIDRPDAYGCVLLLTVYSVALITQVESGHFIQTQSYIQGGPESGAVWKN